MSTDTAGSVGAVEVRQNVEWMFQSGGFKGPAGISDVSLSKKPLRNRSPRKGTKHVCLLLGPPILIDLFKVYLV